MMIYDIRYILACEKIDNISNRFFCRFTKKILYEKIHIYAVNNQFPTIKQVKDLIFGSFASKELLN